jgi:hypothetical protein
MKHHLFLLMLLSFTISISGISLNYFDYLIMATEDVKDKDGDYIEISDNFDNDYYESTLTPESENDYYIEQPLGDYDEYYDNENERNSEYYEDNNGFYNNDNIPNSPPGETPGSPPGETPGSPPGETPGSQPGETPGSPPGETPGS